MLWSGCLAIDISVTVCFSAIVYMNFFAYFDKRNQSSSVSVCLWITMQRFLNIRTSLARLRWTCNEWNYLRLERIFEKRKETFLFPHIPLIGGNQKEHVNGGSISNICTCAVCSTQSDREFATHASPPSKLINTSETFELNIGIPAFWAALMTLESACIAGKRPREPRNGAKNRKRLLSITNEVQARYLGASGCIKVCIKSNVHPVRHKGRASTRETGVN